MTRNEPSSHVGHVSLTRTLCRLGVYKRKTASKMVLRNRSVWHEARVMVKVDREG